MSRGSPLASRVVQAWAVSPTGEEVAKGAAIDPLASPRRDTRPSSPCPLARHFETLKGRSPERRTDAALADVAEAASRSLHQASQLHRPLAQHILEGFPYVDRHETLVWLIQAYDAMNFSDAALFDTALLLDRYYAAQPREDIRGGGSLQRKLLAAVCMALKTGSEDTQLPVRQVVSYFGRDQVPFDEVLAAELTMLKKLRFSVGTPTALDFLETLGTRLFAERGPGVLPNLAEFLLQLTLVDANLHYRHAHAVLAAGCLALALFATSAAPSAYVTLLEDLALHCPEAACPHGMLVPCVADLHRLWVQSIGWHEQGERSYARNICTKFSHAVRYAVSNLPPPPTPPVSFPPMQSWVPLGAAGDDLQEAALILQHSLAESGEERERHSRCPRCDRTWQLPAPHGGLCTACSAVVELVPASRGQEDLMWPVVLAAQLRPAADASYRVRSVLARHGWANGRFRRPPDRGQLHRDLLRAARGRNTMERATAIGAVHNAERVTVADRAMAMGRQTTMSAAAPPSGTVLRTTEASSDQRRRRATSWSGQRNSARSVSGVTMSRSP